MATDIGILYDSSFNYLNQLKIYQKKKKLNHSQLTDYIKIASKARLDPQAMVYQALVSCSPNFLSMQLLAFKVQGHLMVRVADFRTGFLNKLKKCSQFYQ